MKTIRTAFISCTFLFALGASAQYPAGGQATQPMQPQPQQGGIQPSQPSQTQPGQDQSAQPGQQPAPQAQGAGRPSIDDQVQSLSHQLNLSADQQVKVKTALEDQHTQAMTIVQDNSMAREDKMQKIHAIRESTINKVRTTLNDDQKKKFDAMVQQQEQHYQQQQQAPPPKQ
jgi:hypothetical protein